MSNLYFVTAVFATGDRQAAASEAVGVETRLRTRGAIDPEVRVDVRADCVDIRFAVASDPGKVISDIRDYLEHTYGWTPMGDAYYAEAAPRDEGVGPPPPDCAVRNRRLRGVELLFGALKNMTWPSSR